MALHNQEGGCWSWTGSVPEQLSGQRVDRAVAELVADLSRSQAKRLIDDGLCLVNGAAVEPSAIVAAGDEIRLQFRPPDTDVQPQDMRLDVLYEDEQMMVVNKPPGLAVHPGSGQRAGTLLNALVHHTAKGTRPTLVHRLDRYTSGAIVVAKAVAAHRDLKQQIEDNTLERIYNAVAWGVPDPRTGVIEAPLGQSRGHKEQMEVLDDGRPAATHYATVKTYATEFGGTSLVMLKLGTGRTHQIRAHFEWLGHPLVGERVYRGQRELTPLDELLQGQALHSAKVKFRHPHTGEWTAVRAPIAGPMRELLERLESESTDASDGR